MIHIVVGCVRYIKNVGLFKTFSFLIYKFKWNFNKVNLSQARPLTLAEYTMEYIYNEKYQRDVAWVMCYGIIWVAASIAVAYIAYM